MEYKEKLNMQSEKGVFDSSTRKAILRPEHTGESVNIQTHTYRIRYARE
ncbi:hypothetical protein [Leptospira wolffii]|nr:hypothetical protein [Leptospira wolffii]